MEHKGLGTVASHRFSDVLAVTLNNRVTERLAQLDACHAKDTRVKNANWAAFSSRESVRRAVATRSISMRPKTQTCPQRSAEQALAPTTTTV